MKVKKIKTSWVKNEPIMVKALVIMKKMSLTFLHVE
jgi:hypothetical protein